MMTRRSRLVHKFVAGRLKALATLPERPRKAMLAKLRRGVGRAPGDLPELWGIFLESIPSELESKTGRPTPGEWVAYLALTLYALHQQGHDLSRENMNRPGKRFNFGKAVRRLANTQIESDEGPEKASVLRRLNALATAESMPERAHYLRGIIELLRAKDIPLNYARLAENLYRLQDPDHVHEVRLEWGQDYYRFQKDEDSEKEN